MKLLKVVGNGKKNGRTEERKRQTLVTILKRNFREVGKEAENKIGTETPDEQHLYGLSS